MEGEHAIGPLHGESNFLGIMFKKMLHDLLLGIPFDAEVDAPFYMILEKLKMICFWCFFSYEQRARKTVSRVAIDRDLKTDDYQMQIDLW